MARMRKMPDESGAPEPAAVWMLASRLVPWARNPRDNADNVERVASAIIEMGFGAPVLARKANLEIIAGHTRTKAVQRLVQLWPSLNAATRGKWSEDAEHIATTGMVPVRLLDLSEDAAHTLALADNRLNELSPWIMPELADLLAEQGAEAAALAGWLSKDVQEITDDLIKLSATEPTEDEIPEPPKVAITQLGDVWQLGQHRLICGDATDVRVLVALMQGKLADLMVTDPPYGVEVVGGTHDPRRTVYRKGPDRKKLANDELTGDVLESFLTHAFNAVRPHLTKGAAWYVWHAGTETVAFIEAAKVLDGYKHILVWVKHNFVFGRADYHYRHEPCLYGWIDGAGHRWFGSRNQSTVFELPRGGGEEIARLIHPTVKPVKLYTTAIENHLRKGEIVVDSFAGSGTAFSAAEQTGRVCFGSELDPAFCDVVVERWQKLSGGKARRIKAA